jgi:hypothetical protein
MVSDDVDSFEFAVFLKEESELFTLLGVFGAISLYLAQFPVGVNNQWLNIGIVSSLLIFITVAISIRGRLEQQLESSIFDFIIKPRQESFQVLIFVVPFYLLSFSVFVVAVQYQAAGQFVAQAILVFFGISTVLYAIVTGEELVGFGDLGEIGRDREVLNFGGYLFVMGLTGFLLAGVGIIHFQNQFAYGLTDILAVSRGPGLVPFVVSYLGGVLAGSFLYIFVALTLYLLHQLVRRIDRMEQQESFKRVYQALFGDGVSDRQTELREFNDKDS